MESTASGDNHARDARTGGQLLRLRAASTFQEGADLSIDELYDRWRDEYEREETIREVKLGIEQIERGEGLSLEEVDRRIRRRLSLPMRET